MVVRSTYSSQYPGDLLKKITLKYNYFSADSATPASSLFNSGIATQTANLYLRLRLDSLQESTIGIYKFYYNSQALPPRNSYAQDFWGYYNGAVNNKSLVPNPTRFNRYRIAHSLDSIPLLNNGNNTSASSPYAQAGLLTKITLPTGGTKTYEYELNTFRNEKILEWVPDYDSVNNVICKGNGVRVKSIISTPLEGNVLVTAYSYKGGKTMLPMNYYRQISYETVNPNSLPNHGGNVYLDRRTFLVEELKASSLYSPSELGSGTGVGYSCVQERHPNGANPGASDLQGKTVYYYSNQSDNNTNANDIGGYTAFREPAPISLPAYQNPTTKQNGLVDSVFSYDASVTLLKKVTYAYQTSIKLIEYGTKLFSGGFKWEVYTNSNASNGVGDVYLVSKNYIGFYPLFEKTSTKTCEVVTQYSPSSVAFTQRVFYNADDYNRTTSKRDDNFTRVNGVPTTFAPGNIYNYSYPDIRHQAGDAYLESVNRLNEPVAIQESHFVNPTNVPVGISIPVGANVTATSYKYEKFYSMGSGTAGCLLDSVRETTTNGAVIYPTNPRAFQRLTRYSQYNAQGHCQKVVSGYDVPIAYLWYADLPLLLAEAKNATPKAIAYTSFEPKAFGSWHWMANWAAGGVTGNYCTRLTGSTAGAAYRLATPATLPLGTYTFTYWAKGGLPQLSVPSPSTVTTPQTLATRPDGWTQYRATIKLLTTGVQVDFAQNAAISVDELRLCPVGVQLLSYTYGPWQNITSQTDATGRLTIYEFDAAGRLLRARDEQGRIMAQQQYHYAGQR